jgi:hypothetical protein
MDTCLFVLSLSLSVYASSNMVIPVVCPCCYETFENDELDQLVECDAKVGHMLCKACLQAYVREELDGKNNTVLVCCVGASGCDGRYGELVLRKSIPSDLKERFDKVEYLEMVKKFEGVW